MSTGDAAEKSIKIIHFSGKKDEWQVWSEKFLARARRKNYKGILTGSERVPPVSMSANGEAIERTDAERRLDNANELAFEDLVLSVDGTTEAGRVAFGIIRSSKTTELPEGDARLAWEKLERKYVSKTALSRLMLKKKLGKMRLKRARDDPDVWLTKLEDMCRILWPLALRWTSYYNIR